MFFVPFTSLPFIAANIIEVLVILIFVEAILANIIAFGGKLSPYHPLVKFVRAIVNPILAPVRRMIPPYKMHGWDVSPLIMMVVLQVVRNVLVSMG